MDRLARELVQRDAIISQVSSAEEERLRSELRAAIEGRDKAQVRVLYCAGVKCGMVWFAVLFCSALCFGEKSYLKAHELPSRMRLSERARV